MVLPAQPLKLPRTTIWSVPGTNSALSIRCWRSSWKVTGTAKVENAVHKSRAIERNCLFIVSGLTMVLKAGKSRAAQKKNYPKFEKILRRIGWFRRRALAAKLAGAERYEAWVDLRFCSS